MADIQPGHEYAPSEIVTHTNLNEHVSQAVILPEFISAKTLKDPAALSDELAINDAGVLKKITMVQLKALIAQAIGSDGLAEEARLPAGIVADYAGTVEPAGWLFCFGQAISRTETYARLFAAIGTVYGAGDGSTTFNVPDYRGRVGAGKDDMGGFNAARIGDPAYNVGLVGAILGSAGGAHVHTLTVAELPAHAHSFNDYYQITTAPGGGGNIQFGNDNHVQEAGATTPNGTFNTGNYFPHNNVQPTIMINKIIRYG